MKFRLLAILPVVLPIAVLGSRSLIASANPSSFTPPTCENIQLTYSKVGSSAGVGHVGVQYQVHNQWRSACSLYGYPGAVLLDRQFHSLPTAVQRGVGYLSGRRFQHLVTLQGSRDGYLVVEWVHIPAPGQSCPLAPYLMITAPGDRLPNVIYGGAEGGAIDACGGIIHVTPVQQSRIPF